MADASGAIAFGNRKERRRMEAERLQRTAKGVQALVKANPTILEKLGMDPLEFDVMSASDQVGMFEGLLTGLGYQQALADVELSKKRLENFGKLEGAQTAAIEEETGLMKDRRERLSRFGQSLESFERIPETIRKPRSAFLEGEMMRLMPEDASRYANVLESFGRPIPMEPEEVPGADYVRLRVGPQSYTAVPKPEARRGNAKMMARAESWVLTDDTEEFKRKLLTIEDPAIQEAVLSMRRQYNLATGKGESEIAQIIKALNPEAAGKTEKKTEGIAERFRKWKQGRQ
jgi:hypothetical protein